MDSSDWCGPDLLHDIQRGLPFCTSSVAEIRAHDILEHVDPHFMSKIALMNELWRVMVPDGIIGVRVPHPKGPGAWQDPTHVSVWNIEGFRYFEESAEELKTSMLGRGYGIRSTFKILEHWEDDILLHVKLQAIKERGETGEEEKGPGRCCGHGKIRLNIGCGGDYFPGWINMDRSPEWGNPDLVHDIQRGLPFCTSSVMEIRAQDVLEHIDPHYMPKVDLMNELHRVLAPGGLLKIRVPHLGSPAVWEDPTHVSVWNLEGFRFFTMSAEELKTSMRGRGYGIRAVFEILEDYEDDINLNIQLQAVKV